MHELDLTHAQWRKSHHSSANGACVEVARNVASIVAVRDSKDPDGAKLVVDRPAWAAFVRGLKDRRPSR